MTGVRNARATLQAGFTTVRDVGNYRAFVDVALRDAIDAGWTPGPRMMVAGAFISCSGRRRRHQRPGARRREPCPAELRVGIVDTVDDVTSAVRRILYGGADLIKVIATGAVMSDSADPGVPELTEAQIRAAVEEATLHGAHVAAHAHGAEGIKRAVRAGVHSIEHGSLMDDEGVAMMAEAGTWLVADIYGGDYIAAYGREHGWKADVLRKNDETTVTQREAFEKCVAAGVRIAYGTDSGIYPHGENARQLAYHVRHGQSPVEAIRSADPPCGRPDGLVGPDRPGRARPVRRPRRGRRRPDRRRTPARGRVLRDEGRRGRTPDRPVGLGVETGDGDRLPRHAPPLDRQHVVALAESAQTDTENSSSRRKETSKTRRVVTSRLGDEGVRRLRGCRAAPARARWTRRGP